MRELQEPTLSYDPSLLHKKGIEYVSINGAKIGFKQYGKEVKNINPTKVEEYLASAKL